MMQIEITIAGQKIRRTAIVERLVPEQVGRKIYPYRYRVSDGPREVTGQVAHERSKGALLLAYQVLEAALRKEGVIE